MLCWRRVAFIKCSLDEVEYFLVVRDAGLMALKFKLISEVGDLALGLFNGFCRACQVRSCTGSWGVRPQVHAEALLSECCNEG